MSPLPVITGVDKTDPPPAAVAFSPWTEACCCMADGVVAAAAAWFTDTLLDASTENANECKQTIVILENRILYIFQICFS